MNQISGQRRHGSGTGFAGDSELQFNTQLLIVCKLELINLQKNYGGVKVIMIGTFVCDCRWIGEVSEYVC